MRELGSGGNRRPDSVAPKKGIMASIEKALQIAAQAHEGQKDKDGQPYILHPLRVMNAVESEAEKVVAILHE
jgi:(p)ppGpp synthase/HD superfamily hydrolase